MWWILVILDALPYQIEGRRFRAPIKMFSDSKSFCAMLESATAHDPDAKQDVHLDEISMDEFLCFIKYMNQRFVVPQKRLISPSHAKYRYRRLGGPSIISNVEYGAVLKISTKLRFNTVRATAIRDFPDVDVVDKIVLARDFCVHEWLVPLLNKYAQLRRSITLQDVQRLGLNYILNISQVREKFVQNKSYPHLHEACQRRIFNFASSLEQLFREEIDKSGIQLPSVPPSAAKDFEFVLIDIFFLVSSIPPFQQSCLSKHGQIRLRVNFSSRTVSILKILQSFGRCFPFQFRRTTFPMAAQNLNRYVL